VELSVITVTFDRRKLLLEKLAALKAQTLSPERFEWLVYVNASEDDTLRILQSTQTPFKLTLLRSDTRKSAAAARNACARAATGDFLYFSDDDCLPDEGTLEHHLAYQQLQPSAVIGSITFEDEGRISEWKPERVGYWNLNGANSSVPREAFAAVGGFAEDFDSYGGEDVLLGYRLFQYSLPFIALPEAGARHLGSDPMRSRNAVRAREAGKSAARIAQKYSQLAFRLGVGSPSLITKRLLLWPPYGVLWRVVDRPSYDYERAYLAGALEERHHAD
jgi:GT2 family glycosyltransferase